MLKRTRTLTLSAALLGAVLLGSATPGPGGAAPIVNGHGSFEIPGATISFQVSAVELPDGSLQGHGVSTRNDDDGGVGNFQFDVTETLHVGDTLFVAGIITKVHDAPPGFLGSLAVVGIQDNGNGGDPADRMISGAGIPPSLTLAEIVSFPPPMGPPPVEVWPSLVSGDFTVHE